MRSSARAGAFARSRFGQLAAVAAFAIIVVGCGGDPDDSASNPAGSGAAPSADGSAGAPSEDSPGIVDFDDNPVVGTDGYAGPDWFPTKMAVLLPRGLAVTLESQDPTTGKAELTGWISGGDMDDLMSSAKFMVRAEGYFPGEDFDNGSTRGFTATTLGQTILFGLVDIDGDIVQWSMEFVEDPPETEASDDLIDDADSELAGTAIVEIGELEWQVSGGCDSQRSTFYGFDGSVTLSIGYTQGIEDLGGSFGDAGQGVVLFVGIVPPSLETTASGFTVIGTYEGDDYSIEVTCEG